MKTPIFIRFFLLLCLPFSASAQNDLTNPQTQQVVNLYGGTNLDNNPQSINKVLDNNEFAIHEVVQKISVKENAFDQQVSNLNKPDQQNFSSSGGGAVAGSMKLGLNFRKSKLRFDKKIHRLFYRAPKKKRSSTSCFSWS